jgi:hypothetical protein
MADPTEPAPAPEPDEDLEEAPAHEGFLDKLRGGMGTADPNIVGDVGPTDVPPGSDGDQVRPHEQPARNVEV